MQIDTQKQVYEAARSMFVGGLHDEAVSHLRSALKCDESAGRLWELLGMIEYSRLATDAAMEALEHASLCKPMSPRAQIVLAECYLKHDFRESARSIYLHVQHCKNLATDLLEPLASGLGRVGAYRNALSTCQRAAEQLPESSEPIMGIVYYMRKLSCPAEEVLPYLFKLHHRNPEDADYRVRLAWALHECGRSEDGAYLLSVLPIREFDCIRCLTLMQTVFQAVGDRDSAMTCRMRLEALAGERRVENPGGENR